MPEPVATHRAFSGRFLAVDVESWEGIGTVRGRARIHDAAAVLPITPAGDVVLVRQLRPPVRQVLTEIPAGLLDVDGEDALSCASRELFEETGYRHDVIEFLGGYYASAGSATSTSTCSGRARRRSPKGSRRRGSRSADATVRADGCGCARGEGSRREDGARAAARGRTAVAAMTAPMAGYPSARTRGAR